MHWITKKPKTFKEDCLLLTASRINKKEPYDYTCFEIIKIDSGDGWYWGIFTLDHDEWGDYKDLEAQKYCILTMLK
jgi:hypothetical protein